MSTKLYCILARNSSKAVIFRRGPSKEVRLILWDRRDDSFKAGQWLKGRVYERRCDLSPNGEFLAYFAATYKPPLSSWTAISRPPYLTALALWPNGSGWGGGGVFDSDATFCLNQRLTDSALKDGTSVPKGLRILEFGQYPGRGEDQPVLDFRMIRDGWKRNDTFLEVEPKWNENIVWDYGENPLVYEKSSDAMKHKLVLCSKTKGIHKRNGSSYLIDHQVRDENQNEVLNLPDTDWADWDENGDLLFSKEGKIFRAVRGSRSPSGPLGAASEIADFEPMKFEQVVCPESKANW